MENYTDSLLSQTELLLMSACGLIQRPILPICGGEYTATARTHSYIHVGLLQWTGSLPHVTTFDIRSHVTQYNIFLALYRRLPLQNGEHKLFDTFNRDAKYTDERLDSPKPVLNVIVATAGPSFTAFIKDDSMNLQLASASKEQYCISTSPLASLNESGMYGVYRIRTCDIRQRIQAAKDARLPFIVAVERGSGNQRENIFGFATAKDYTGSETSGRYTAELESFVIPEQQRKGIGNCLMDKLLKVCDGFDFLCHIAVRMGKKGITDIVMRTSVSVASGLKVSLILMAWVVCLRNIWSFLSRRNASSPKAGAIPVSVTPISKAQAGKLADARMTGAALGVAFKCSVLEGQHHYQGFATQTSWTSTSQRYASHRPKMIEYGVAIMYIRAAKLSLSTSRFNRMISMNGGGQYGNIIVPSDYTLFKYHWPVTLADVEEPIENPLEFSLESFRNCFVEDE
ncbi:hypothetical protein BO79DRAFT_256599 [Aspergillus costaricaensis CBS 115574]|uniref:Uncharacterized protein n=1 Tax=Aspergillus costaricaensis CBS 115574 TaxID=1448317 RepID=A0ACD1IA44_9EURO|nr:hypothetical protein BO79DRAFT_256599 [Aspergillus costaricaensis CBS 115574]RAK87103.1 hypothetical protein BO79DRAFT_256599 [Aspergillus costaricaensis CBS 115574]